MSIALRTNSVRLLGVGAAALALSAVAASPAIACAHGQGHGGSGWGHGGSQVGYHPGHEGGGHHSGSVCEFSLNNGSAWTTSVKIDEATLAPTADGKLHIKVRDRGNADCTVSLASYQTHGATWEDSGVQTFVDFDSVTVHPKHTDTLNVLIPDAGCFAQVDLYKGNVQYDGQPDTAEQPHDDLPIGPSHPVIGDQLIASWNGGTKECTTAPTTPPTDTPSDTPTPSDSAPPTDTPTVAPTESAPSDSGSPTVAPTESAPSDSGSPSVAPTESAPVSPSTSASESAAAPVADISAPSSPAPGTALAETGSSGAGTMSAIAGALAVVGGAVLFTARRSRRAARR